MNLPGSQPSAVSAAETQAAKSAMRVSTGGISSRWRNAHTTSKSSQLIGGYDSIGFMTATTEALPNDPDMLKAMLLAERAESERLRQIIKELQRHRFGRRAESLPEEQLQLGLEEAEQVEAAGHAE